VRIAWLNAGITAPAINFSFVGRVAAAVSIGLQPL
jgi:hypothetical protein